MSTMPHRLKQRQAKIQQKRKQTPWREFVMEICSWMPCMLHKNKGLITPYPSEHTRFGDIVEPNTYEDIRNTPQGILSSGNFFSDLKALQSQTPVSSQKVLGHNENSKYNYIILGAKDSYLSIVVIDSSNVSYSYSVFGSDSVLNSILIDNSSMVYNCRCVSKSHKILGSSNIEDCSDIWYSANLQNCSFCIGCDGLTNQSYHIKNKPVTSQEYTIILTKIRNNIETATKLHQRVLSREGNNTGDSIVGSFNRKCDDVDQGHFNYQLKYGRNVVLCNATEPLQRAYDCCSIGGLTSADLYGCMGVGYGCEQIYCSVECSPNCSSIYYSYLLDTCSYCLGCIGLKNKSYCIFNKQYSKEERYDKVDEIFTQMEQDGTLGKFFPGSMNPFYFNDTAAYLIDDSFTKEEVEAAGYLWRDEAIKVDIPEGVEVVKVSELEEYEGWVVDGDFVSVGQVGSPHPSGTPLTEGGKSTDAPLNKGGERGDYPLPDKKRTIDPSILKKVIQDEQGNVYRIVKMEYDFLVKHGLPLPRKHWLERIKQHFKIG